MFVFIHPITSLQEPCLLSHIRIYNKSVLEWEISVGLRYKVWNWTFTPLILLLKFFSFHNLDIGIFACGLCTCISIFVDMSQISDVKFIIFTILIILLCKTFYIISWFLEPFCSLGGLHIWFQKKCKMISGLRRRGETESVEPPEWDRMSILDLLGATLVWIEVICHPEKKWNTGFLILTLHVDLITCIDIICLGNWNQ